MKELTQQNFYMAIQECLDTEHYKVLLVTETFKDLEMIITDWLQPIEHIIPDVIKIVKSRNNFHINFANGSYIRHITSNSSYMRGRRANLVLCEPWMMHDNFISSEITVIELCGNYFGCFKCDVV